MGRFVGKDKANAFVFTMLGMVLVVSLTYITRSPRPETQFLVMTARFFRACEFLIDYLKTRAPFWKKELTPDGERWVDARQGDTEAERRWSADSPQK